uniref:Eukaryotic translation initiation factor 3 subunit B n=3 Tax=Noccaea caerulescens TaxID=107243 RepID=A0A1J3H284_NOCCA
MSSHSGRRNPRARRRRSKIVERDPIQVSPVVDQPSSSQELDKGSCFRFMTAEEVHSHKEESYYSLRGISGPLEPPFDPEDWDTDDTTLAQILIRSGNIAEVLRVDETRLLPKKHSNFHGMFINAKWSPLGTYLATLEHEGVVAWGVTAKRSTLLMRYFHHLAEEADFSPGEKFLVTYKKPDTSNHSGVHFKIFEVQTGDILMGGGGGPADASWPMIRWAGGKDDKYFATFSKNTVSVYDTDGFASSDMKPVIVVDDDHVVDMAWSPTQSILALIKGDGKKQSPKVVLLEIPSKVELTQKNLLSVEECKLYWQSNGEYLAVKVDCGFQLFTIEDGGVDILKLKNILAFAWEPNGDRFAVIHFETPKPSVSFYSVDGKLSKLSTLEAMEVDALFWSPRGKYIVLSGLKSCNGKLTFFNADTLKTMATGEHLNATDVAWDVTGHFLSTAKIAETEYEVLDHSNTPKMWSFSGELLHCDFSQYGFNHLWQLEWRPYGDSIDELMRSP